MLTVSPPWLIVASASSSLPPPPHHRPTLPPLNTTKTIKQNEHLFMLFISDATPPVCWHNWSKCQQRHPHARTIINWPRCFPSAILCFLLATGQQHSRDVHRGPIVDALHHAPHCCPPPSANTCILPWHVEQRAIQHCRTLINFGINGHIVGKASRRVTQWDAIGSNGRQCAAIRRYSGLVWMHIMHEWPLAIHWRLGFSGKGFHTVNIVELRGRAHFFFSK